MDFYTGMNVLHLAPDGSKTALTSSFRSMNRDKKSLTNDLSKPQGQEIVAQLAAQADVLI